MIIYDKVFYNCLKGRCSLLVLILFLATCSFAQQSTTKNITAVENSISVKKAGFRLGFFPILCWDFINSDSAIAGIVECNFTLGGFVEPQNISSYEKMGLPLIVVVDKNNSRKWSKLSDREIDNRIKMMVDKGGDSKVIMGYYIMDEPSASDFSALSKAVVALRKYAPGKLAYINLFPNYATLWTMDRVKSQLGTKTYTEYLERFVNEVKPELISYDNYMVEFSMDMEKTELAAKYYTNLVEVRRIALKYDLPFWNVVSSNQIRPHTTIPSPANLSLQAYTTLAAGASGISWFKYFKSRYQYSPIDESGNRTLTWRYLQEVNRQVSILGTIVRPLTSTGVYFTSATPGISLPLLPGNWVQEVNTNTPMMVGEFKCVSDSNYIMVVNLSLEKSARFELTTRIPKEKLSILALGENGEFVNLNGEEGIWLTAGHGVLIKCGGESLTKPVDEKPKY